MTEQAKIIQDPEDTAPTVRLPVRSALLAQIEGALLAEKIAGSILDEKGRGKDPYNQVPLRSETWGKDR